LKAKERQREAAVKLLVHADSQKAGAVMKTKYYNLVLSKKGTVGVLVKRADTLIKETKDFKVRSPTKIHNLIEASKIYRQVWLIMNDDIIQYQRAILSLERQIDNLKECYEAADEAK
jgi:hypothetical protein